MKSAPGDTPLLAPLLEVRGLRTSFAVEGGEFHAVDGVDFVLGRGRTLGIVGESGCGKSVTALSIMGLVPQPPGRIAGGEVLFEGADLLKLAPERMRDLRGDQLSMIFQEPMTSLNPAFTIGDQITEAILRHRDVTPLPRRASRRSRCSSACASRRLSSASTNTRTSSRAACASA